MKAKYINSLMIIIFLVVTLSTTVYGNVYNTSYTQASPIFAETPKVILQRGTAGSSVIYTNNTSARVSVVAPTSILSISGMIAYGEGTIDTPRYRIWNGSGWGAEGSASVTSANIQWVVLKSNPKGGEKVLGTLASTGAIHVQVWNGSKWSPAKVLGSGVGTTNDAYRGFDVAYEQVSGRALVVFVPSATAIDPQYVIWNGSSWFTPATIDVPTTGVIYWIKLASRPNSNQIALMTLDANADIAAVIWNGSTWSNAKILTTAASTATRECFAVEYEQQSGYAMFVWGEQARGELYYWRWNGTEWIGATKTLLNIPQQGGVSNWIVLKADPNSNKLMLGVQDAGADLNTREWNGMSWDSSIEHPEHDATVENVQSRNFDIEYETFSGHSGHAILVWGDGNTASWKHWTPTTGSSGWSAATVLTGSDDTAVTQLRRNSDGKIIATLLDDPTSATDDLAAYTWNGTRWSSRFIIEDNPSVTVQPMMEPFMVAPDIHTTSAEYTYDYVLKILNKVSDPWMIRLKAYSQNNIWRLNNCTIYFYNGGVSIQISIVNGECSQRFGNWYNLSGLSTVYIAMTVSAASAGTSYVYACLEVNIPGTSTYHIMIITFEIT